MGRTEFYESKTLIDNFLSRLDSEVMALLRS